MIDGNIKGLCLLKNQENFDDEVIFAFLKNIINVLFTKYTREYLDQAPNFSLRDFVCVLKKNMNEFQNSKQRKNIIIKYRTFSERRDTEDDMRQTFINRTIGIISFI